MRGRLHRHETTRFYCATLPDILKLRHKCSQYPCLRLLDLPYPLTPGNSKGVNQAHDQTPNGRRLAPPFALNNVLP